MPDINVLELRESAIFDAMILPVTHSPDHSMLDLSFAFGCSLWNIDDRQDDITESQRSSRSMLNIQHSGSMRPMDLPRRLPAPVRKTVKPHTDLGIKKGSTRVLEDPKNLVSSPRYAVSSLYGETIGQRLELGHIQIRSLSS